MLKGKTSTGFSFSIDDDAKDDYDLFNAFNRVQDGQVEALKADVIRRAGTRLLP